MLTLLLHADTNDERNDDERLRDDERHDQDEREGVPEERVRVQARRTASSRESDTKSQDPKCQHGRVPTTCHARRNRASPISVLADEKVMLEKEPILALAEEKEIIGLMSSSAKEEDEDEASKEPYITSTKNSFAILGELMDTEVVTEAAGSLDKMSGWPEGGIASAGNIVDNMSGYVRARLNWCPRS